MFLCHVINLLFHRLDISSSCLFINLPFHQFAISSTFNHWLVNSTTCHFINVPFHQHVISPTWHFIDTPFHQHDILSTCHFFICQSTKYYFGWEDGSYLDSRRVTYASLTLRDKLELPLERLTKRQVDQTA